MSKKESGMTLIEVLAALVLSSLVILLIWTTVAVSMKYNIVETRKLHMQQEANFIITDLQRIHRGDYICYEVKDEGNGRWRIIECETRKTISHYESDEYIYTLSVNTGKIYTKWIEGDANKKSAYLPSYPLTVRITSRSGTKANVEVDTTISRYDERIMNER